jgi:hypothetical protein
MIEALHGKVCQQIPMFCQSVPMPAQLGPLSMCHRFPAQCTSFTRRKGARLATRATSTSSNWE